MRFFLLSSVLLACCSCARTQFVRAPEPFKPLPADASLEHRQAYFDRQRVHIISANHGEIGGRAYNATELLRYYDDSRNGDSSELQKRAVAKVPRAEDWAFFGTAYGSIIGAVVGGIRAYLATPVYDFAALNSVPSGAFPGLGWGMLAGMAVGWTGFALERHSALNLQQEAAGEFNRSARALLKLEMAPQPGGAKAGIFLEY